MATISHEGETMNIYKARELQKRAWKSSTENKKREMRTRFDKFGNLIYINIYKLTDTAGLHISEKMSRSMVVNQQLGYHYDVVFFSEFRFGKGTHLLEYVLVD